MRIHRLIVTGLLALAALAVPASPATAAAPLESAHLWNTTSGGCLAARAGRGERPVVKTRCDVTIPTIYADQYWKRTPNRYGTQLRSTMLDLCMVPRGTGEAVLVATTCGDWPDQAWQVWYDSFENSYQFENVYSGLCLAARGTVHDETRAIVTTCDFDAGQVWGDQHWKVI